MDGQRVKGWEARCVEEQPPACTTACPLHLDVRAMLEKMKQTNRPWPLFYKSEMADLTAYLNSPEFLGAK